MNDVAHLRFVLRLWIAFRDWYELSRDMPLVMTAELQAEWECFARGQFEYPGSGF